MFLYVLYDIMTWQKIAYADKTNKATCYFSDERYPSALFEK